MVNCYAIFFVLCTIEELSETSQKGMSDAYLFRTVSYLLLKILENVQEVGMFWFVGVCCRLIYLNVWVDSNLENQLMLVLPRIHIFLNEYDWKLINWIRVWVEYLCKLWEGTASVKENQLKNWGNSMRYGFRWRDRWLINIRERLVLVVLLWK